MKAPFLLAVLTICFIFSKGQDSKIQSQIESGKFYGIFPKEGNYIVYSDTVLIAGPVNKEDLLTRTKDFFARNDGAKYFFESESSETGDIVYQGVLNRSLMSQKSVVHFSMSGHIADSGYIIRIYEIVMAKPESQYVPITSQTGGQLHTGYIKTDNEDKTVSLENVDIDKGEFSRKYCEKLDKKFTMILDELKAAIH